MSNSRIVLAVDTKNLNEAKSLIQETFEFIGVYKLGLEFFLANGIAGVQSIKSNFPGIRIFLDLKLHDIPNTVANAALNFSDLGIEFLTVHASGGSEMISAATRALPNCKISAVTVLTSLSEDDLEALGMRYGPKETVLDWAKIAVASGARAIVTSPLEVNALRRELPAEIELITPGIRFDGAKDDQARTMTPQEAISAGSDFLVVGRPITKAEDRKAAAKSIFESISF